MVTYECAAETVPNTSIFLTHLLKKTVVNYFPRLNANRLYDNSLCFINQLILEEQYGLQHSGRSLLPSNVLVPIVGWIDLKFVPLLIN